MTESTRSVAKVSAAWTRREVLRSGVVTFGGLLVGTVIPAVTRAAVIGGVAGASAASGEYGITAWVRVTPDNVVTLIMSQAEIGQGISTTLPAILADELGAAWGSVRLESAPFSAAYANPRNKWMFTGNSESIQSFHDHMRKMGAAAREMLIRAAARRWAVPIDECRAIDGTIVHVPTGGHVFFGDVASEAAQLSVPTAPMLKPEGDRRTDGVALQRVDVPAKVDGSGVFGIDFRVPGMLMAAVRLAPAVGGSVKTFDAAAVQGMPGVRNVIEIPRGVAVVADSFWHARSALLALPLEFEPGPHGSVDSESIEADMTAALGSGPFATPVNEGDSAQILASARRTVRREYHNPFLAHATMEPMNCTASVTDERCEIWAPTQGQQLAHEALKSTLGFRDDQITVNRTPYIGGAFGRRLLPDFVVQAAVISRAVKHPVKVIWDREEDFAQDWYRPATAVRLEAALDTTGMPTGLAARVVSPTILLPVYPKIAPVLASKKVDPSCMEGMTETRYAFGARRVDFHLFQTPLRTSMLRTTGYGPNLFALESFIDELAHSGHHDPYQFRRKLLAKEARSLGVLDRAAQLAQWGKRRSPRHGLGMAFADCFGSLLAMVAEVEVAGKAVRVVRVTTVVDAGRVLDPGISAANIEGGIIFGLAGCKSSISFKGGAAEQQNFNTYLMPSLAETPEMVTEFINGGGKLGAIGEISPVTLTPALANAIFAATGRRLRSMPLSRHDLSFA